MIRCLSVVLDYSGRGGNGSHGGGSGNAEVWGLGGSRWTAEGGAAFFDPHQLACLAMAEERHDDNDEIQQFTYSRFVKTIHS